MEWFIIITLAVAAAGALIAVAVKHFNRRRAYSQTPLSTVKEMEEGRVKLEGQAVAFGEPIQSPMSGAPCVYYKFLVEEKRQVRDGDIVTRDRHGRRRSSGTATTRDVWDTVIDDTRYTECGIKDSTGTASLDMHDADPHLSTKKLNTGLLSGCPAEVQRRLEERYGRSTKGVMFSKSMRFRESVILEGDQILVVGYAKKSPKQRPVIGRDPKLPLLISDRSEAATLRHHAFMSAGSVLGAVAIVAGAAWLLMDMESRKKEHLAGAKLAAPAPAPAAGEAPAAQLVAGPVGGKPDAPAPKPAPPTTPEERAERDLREAKSTDPTTRATAVRRLHLEYKEPVKEHQAEIAAVLMDRMKSSDGDSYDAAQALVVWATPRELAEVPQYLGHQVLTRQALAILGKFQVVSEAENVASFLKTLRKEASDALVAMGPGAEAAVLPYLDDRDSGVKREACYVLQRIGSARSLPGLDMVRQDRDRTIAQQAQVAARTIRKRENLADPDTPVAAATPAAAIEAAKARAKAKPKATETESEAQAEETSNEPSAEWARWAAEWSILGQKQLQHGTGVQSLAYSRLGKFLATSGTGVVRIWDAMGAVNKPRLVIDRLGATPRDILFLPGDKRVVLGMDDNSLRVIDVATPKPFEKIRRTDHTGDVLSLALSANGKALASGGEDMAIVVYDLAAPMLDQKQVMKIENAALGVTWLGFVNDDQAVVAITGSGDVRLWDISNAPAREVGRTRVRISSATPAADVSPDRKTLALAEDSNRSVSLWSITATGFVRKHTWKDLSQREIGALAYAGGPILAAADLSGRVILWNTETREKVLDKQGTGQFRAATFAPFLGKPADAPRLRLAVGSRSGKGDVTILDLAVKKK